MSRIAPLDLAQAHGKTLDTLNAVTKMLGVTPNLFRVAAVAPSVLEGLVALNGSVAHGTLKAKVRESLALAVAEANGCDYCLSAHTALGKGAGLTDDETERARGGASADPKTEALLRFAGRVVELRGKVTGGDLAALREARVSDAETLEVVANVVLNIFTNYLNLVAETEIDFPVVRAHAK